MMLLTGKKVQLLAEYTLEQIEGNPYIFVPTKFAFRKDTCPDLVSGF